MPTPPSRPAAAALRRLGYQGVVGLEAWAAGDTGTALDCFRSAFGTAAADAR
ncbi:hypothetical protein ACWKSP_39850 [Micromonosporaceae bacterium Da 78-11]